MCLFSTTCMAHVFVFDYVQNKYFFLSTTHTVKYLSQTTRRSKHFLIFTTCTTKTVAQQQQKQRDERNMPSCPAYHQPTNKSNKASAFTAVAFIPPLDRQFIVNAVHGVIGGAVFIIGRHMRPILFCTGIVII
jgi:hypothetical protein